MLDLGLGGTAATGLERLLARRVGGSASVRDVEAEGLADVYLGICPLEGVEVHVEIVFCVTLHVV